MTNSDKKFIGQDALALVQSAFLRAEYRFSLCRQLNSTDFGPSWQTKKRRGPPQARVN